MTTPDPNTGIAHVPYSLTEFSAAVNAFLGRNVGMAEIVIDLHAARWKLAAYEKRRKEIQEALRMHYDRGNLRCGASQLRLVGTGKSPDRIVVRSEEVKKRFPAVYRACRAPVPYTQVKAPKQWSTPKFWLPGPPNPRSNLNDLRLRDADMPDMAAVKTAEFELTTSLDAVFTAAGSDGMPHVTTDDWTFGIKRLQFSSNAMKAQYPEEWKALAAFVPGTDRAGYLRFGDVSEGDIDSDFATE